MNSNNPFISVIIPTYNNALFIEDALYSVLAQTYRNIEIIVIDDGSTDNTREIIKKYKEIIYLYQDNKGPSSARNLGISISKGEFIAFLDADDIWMPEKLELQMKAIQEDKFLGLLGCNFFAINKSGEIISELIAENYLNDHEFLMDMYIGNILQGGSSAAFIRKECFKRVGIFDENLRFGEDWDMWLRITKKFKVKNLQNTLIKIRKHNLQKTYNDPNIIKSNITKIIEKNLTLRRIKRKAYSHLYVDIARLYQSNNNKFKAIIYLLKALYLYPFKVYKGENKFKLLIFLVSPYIFNISKEVVSFLKKRTI